MELLNDIMKGVEIPCTFRHFLIIDEEVIAVHPVLRELFPSESLGLSNLILMVRK
jgi:hypothetical protein